MTTIDLGAENVRWDLSAFYSGLDDPQIEVDITAFIAMCEEFSAEFKRERQAGYQASMDAGETPPSVLETRLGDAITVDATLTALQGRIVTYLDLLKHVNLNDGTIESALDSANERLSKVIAEHAIFFTYEIVELSDDVIEAQAATSEVVRHHMPWIRKNRMLKEHLLEPDVSAALIKRAQHGPASWANFYSKVEDALRIHYCGEELTLNEALHKMGTSADSDVRAAIMKAVSTAFGGPFRMFCAETLNQIVSGERIENEERGYPHPMAKRNKGGKIPDDVVEALHAAVEGDGAAYAQRFYRLLGAHLGLQTPLKWSDRLAKFPMKDTSVTTFPDALQIVVEAYESFSPTLAALVRKQIDTGCIDAPTMAGKYGGCFNCSGVHPDGTPFTYTLLNHQGSGNDVMTIAHELGHGCHGLLAGEAQGVIQQGAPLAYCETASIFGEMTTFRFMLDKLETAGDKKGMLALIMDKLNGMVSTVVRQIQFSNFERKIHGLGRKFSADELDTLWMETIHQMYGEPGETFTFESAKNTWAYISHFHTPFYVYAYAFGELLTHSLFALQEQFGERFEPLYLDLLRAGGTKNIVELLEPFGLDPTNPDFWKSGLAVSFGTLLQQAEELSAELGVVVIDDSTELETEEIPA